MTEIPLHKHCWETSTRLREQITETRLAYKRRGAADRVIADSVRYLLLPGNKRKTIRLEELREIVATAETRHGVSSQEVAD